MFAHSFLSNFETIPDFEASALLKSSCNQSSRFQVSTNVSSKHLFIVFVLFFLSLNSLRMQKSVFRWSSLVFARVHSCSLVFCRVRSCSLVFARVRSRSLVFARVHSCSLGFTRVCSCSLVFARVRTRVRTRVRSRVRSCSLVFALVGTFSIDHKKV